jgi:sterol O-acyltransferase
VLRSPEQRTSDSKTQPSALGSAEHSADDWSANTSQRSSQSDEEEDYDNLRPDPNAMIEGSSGAGLKVNTAVNGHANGNVPHASSTEQVIEGIKPTSTPARIPLGDRKRSIQITLERTNKKGKYILTADDPEYREIMRNLIERESQTKTPKRAGFRDLVFTRRFTTFDRNNPTNTDSPFFGFFTLFWLCIGGLLVRVAAQNWRQYGHVLGQAEILNLMFEKDVIVLGLTDGAMTAGTLFGVFLQRLIAKELLSWNKYGWIIQNVWQTFFLFAVLWWTWYRDWPWTHTVFTVLHSLVFLMKQHSYAFYNGYLSQVYRRRRILQEKLRQLEDIEPVTTSPTSPNKGFSSAFGEDNAETPVPTRRRRSSAATTKASTNLSKEKSEISAIAAAVDSSQPLDEEQVEAFSSVMKSEIASLTEELAGKATSPERAYPNNLTIANWADWTCVPTLVYELEYPRQETRNWLYIIEKTIATLGCIWVMIIVSQQYIYPSVMETVSMKERGMSLEQRWKEFPWIVGDMLFPLLLEQLMTWYVIWECVLNVLAELTLFADRGFYGDWWNSVSFDQYARDWNRPVHNFLLRHVYHSSISAFKFSKGTATFATFLLSALVHELVMFCLFKKVRGYLFFMQLSQIPLAMLSRTKMLKGRKVLGNIIFWFGLFLGPSIITSLYLIV